MNPKISALLTGGACLVTFAACSSGTSLTVTTSNNDRTESTAPDDSETGSSTPDETVTDESDTDETVTDETVTDETVTDETDTDETDTEETDTDFTVPSDLSLPPGVTLPDLSDLSIPDISIPELPDLSVPISISDEALESCTLFGQIFAQVFAGEGAGTDDLDAALEEIQADLPEEYQGDFDALSEGLNTLQPLFDEYGTDYTKIISDPDALEVYSDPDFLSALTNLQGYFATQCAAG